MGTAGVIISFLIHLCKILLIINEFNKSKESPKDFAKRNIIYDGVRYNQSNVFLENYYSGKRINKLVDNIKKYIT